MGKGDQRRLENLPWHVPLEEWPELGVIGTTGHALQEFVTVLPGWYARRIHDLLGFSVPRIYARRFYNMIPWSPGKYEQR